MNEQQIALQEYWYKLEGMIDGEAINLLAELTELLGGKSPNAVLELAIDHLYKQVVSEGPEQ